MKIYILYQNGLFHSAYKSDESAWTVQDRFRTEFPSYKWEVSGTLLN